MILKVNETDVNRFSTKEGKIHCIPTSNTNTNPIVHMLYLHTYYLTIEIFSLCMCNLVSNRYFNPNFHVHCELIIILILLDTYLDDVLSCGSVFPSILSLSSSIVIIC